MLDQLKFGDEVDNQNCYLHDFDTEYDLEENPYYVCKKCGYEMRDEDDDDE